MSNRAWNVARQTGVASVLLALAACGGGGQERRPSVGSVTETAPARGDAFEEMNPTTSRLRSGFAAGQRVIHMYASLRNVSSHALVIRQIRPRRMTGHGRVAVVESIRLAPRHERQARAIPSGYYQTDPPARDLRDLIGTRKRACGVQKLVQHRGVVLEPSANPMDGMLIAVRIRFVGLGRFRLDGLEVEYEQRGTRFTVTMPLTLVLPVRDRPPRPIPESERRCAHLTRLLTPG